VHRCGGDNRSRIVAGSARRRCWLFVNAPRITQAYF